MPFYNFGNDGAGDALWIEGEITSDGGSWWDEYYGTSARNFRKRLAACKDVTVYINSPGGDVAAGAAIYTALREHAGKVIVKIAGIAASAASVIAMAGDTVLMSPVSYMMIHDPWTITAGNAGELEAEAVRLREIAVGIRNAYALKTGKSDAEIRELMEAETYMNAQSAVEQGFADGILYADGEGEADEDGESRPAGTLMRARNYGSSAVLAMIRAGAEAGTPAEPEEPEEPDTTYDSDDAQLRAEIAQRAEIIMRQSILVEAEFDAGNY